MTITLTPDIENAIVEQARRQGTTPERLAADSLRHLFATASPTPNEILGLAGQVYAGLSEQDINDVETIALDRSNFAGARQLF
jgi:hypothetical protein